MLTPMLVSSASSGQKPRKLFDVDGLYLLIQPSGSKLWRFKYRFRGVEKLISFGSFPSVSLKQARAKRDAARSHVANGVDPSAERQATRAPNANSFEQVAREYLGEQARVLKPVTISDATWRLETFLIPEIGSRPIAEVEAPELLAALRKAQARGLTDTVFRAKQLAGRVFRYAIATGRASHDISADLRGAITTARPQHHAAITEPQAVGDLLRAIDGYVGQVSTRYALRILPYAFLRSSELRCAEWSEIDFGDALWRVPASRTKMARPHLVPLARQVVAMLRELQSFTGNGALLFPGLVPGKPLSENTLNQALMRLGYSKEEQTPHGFRTIASTLLNELGWAPDLIELQLAHRERNQVRAAYNRALRLQERRKMMEAWAEYLDGLKADTAGKVVRLHAAKSA